MQYACADESPLCMNFHRMVYLKRTPERRRFRWWGAENLEAHSLRARPERDSLRDMSVGIVDIDSVNRHFYQPKTTILGGVK